MSKVKDIWNKVKSAAGNTFFGLKLTFTASPGLTVAMIIGYLFQRLLPILEAFALKEIINYIINGNSYDKILIWTVIFIISTVASKLLVNIGYLVFTALEQKTMHRFDNMLINKIIACDLSFFDSSKDNNILKIVQDNKWIITNLMWEGLWIFTNCVSLITTVGIIISLSPVIALIIVLCTIPEIILNRKYYDFIWRYDWVKSNDYRKMYYYYSVMCEKETAEELRLYNNSGFFMGRYFDMWRSWYRDKNQYGIRHNFMLFAANLVRTSSVALTFAYTLLKFAAGKLGIGDIQYYINLTGQIEASFTGVFKTVTEMQVNSEKIAVIRNFLDWKPETQSEGELIPNSMPEIEFINVSFRYPNTERYVLHNCSFKITSGEKIAFVGLNGAGKSTIVKLLLRFYDPEEGEILFNGINAKKYNLKALRRVFGAQFQDFSTYSMSIKESIILGDIRNPDEEKTYEALKFSGAAKFVNKYKNGMETQVSKLFDESGAELSGGQKQKLALSRAYYRNADIMILDEPSASLDPEAEHEIFLKFIELWKNHGAILISHRLSNVTLCDRIIVLDGCEIIEQGSHTELMKQNGKYTHMFNLQAGKYI
ncbi:MAG: ABC transporter ATP-binding protein [Eubacteriales bacterium]